MFILSDLYRFAVGVGDRVLTPGMKQVVKWNHPAGMKYIHFWAPLMKWSLVGAGFGDMLRPANKLSLNQSISLFLTGSIWSRYSMVIVPKKLYAFCCQYIFGICWRATNCSYRSLSLHSSGNNR